MVKFFTYVFPVIGYVLMGVIALTAPEPVNAGEGPSKLNIQEGIDILPSQYVSFKYQWRIICQGGEKGNPLGFIIDANDITKMGIKRHIDGFELDLQSTPDRMVRSTSFFIINDSASSLFISISYNCTIETRIH